MNFNKTVKDNAEYALRTLDFFLQKRIKEPGREWPDSILKRVSEKDTSLTLLEITELCQALDLNWLSDVFTKREDEFGMKTKIKVKLSANATMPTRHKTADAGYDLYAISPVTVPAKGNVLVNTGVSIELPEFTVGLIWPRSGLSTKHNIETGAGVIDAGYRGEIIVNLYNFSDINYQVNTGDRIAQLLIMPKITAELCASETLSESDRMADGLGSGGR